MNMEVAMSKNKEGINDMIMAWSLIIFISFSLGGATETLGPWRSRPCGGDGDSTSGQSGY